MWKSTSVSGALSHFSVMALPRWLRGASRRWSGGRRGDLGRTRRIFDFHAGAVERVRLFRDGQIRYFDRDRATGKVVASSAKLSTLHEDLVDAAETAAMLGPGAPTPWLSGEGEDEFVVVREPPE